MHGPEMAQDSHAGAWRGSTDRQEGQPLDSLFSPAPGGGGSHDPISPAEAQADRNHMAASACPTHPPPVSPDVGVVRRIARLVASRHPGGWHRAISRMNAIDAACDALGMPEVVRGVLLWRVRGPRPGPLRRPPAGAPGGRRPADDPG